MMENTKNPWTTKSSQQHYDNPWISVTEHQVINPSGNDGIYGVVHFKNTAVGVIPMDEQENTWLVGQYRYPTDTYEWEIPEGGGPDGESPLLTAQRELLEETGIVASHYEPLVENMQLSNSVSDETAYIYLATELTFQKASPEETEDLAVRKLPIRQVFEMVHRGEIRDAMSALALLKLQVKLLQSS